MHLAQILNIPSFPSTAFLNNYDQFAAIFISRFLLFTLPLAGFYFFIRLLMAGYNLMTSLGDPAKIQAAHIQILNALLGLGIILSAYFITQIIQVVLAINILR